MAACLICQAPVDPFLTFGRMPLANGFLTPDEFSREQFFNLSVGYCGTCTMVQLTELVDREKMFHHHYPFFTSSSRSMVAHFKQFAGDVMDRYLPGPDPFVVEIGSNDGTMLENFASRGIRHLGFEPSANVARVSEERGIRTRSGFFDENAARQAVSEQGQADACLAANVLCHIPYLHSVAAGIALLLKPKGVLVYEDPYLGDIVEKTSYDQIYDEHAFYFSLSSVEYLFSRHALEVIEVLPQSVHGGSMRYVIGHRGAHPVSESVARRRLQEEAMGLHRPETYGEFRRRVEGSRDALVALLKELRSAGKRVVGYAATSKSTTVTNFCGLTPELVEFISDTTPIKQGKYSPGTHIPVKPYEAFEQPYPDYALLFGWNHAREIFAKEGAFRAAGGKWITYVPRVEVLEPDRD